MVVQSVTEEDLKVADLIVTTTDAFISKGIRKVTGSSVSHAMLYYGDGKVIEAVAEGVRKVPLEEALKGATLAIVLRHTTIRDGARYAVVNYGNMRLGSPYDIPGIVGQGGYQLVQLFCRVERLGNCEDAAAKLTLWMEDEEAFFCSELVATAFQRAGYPIVDIDTETAAVTPQTLLDVTSTGKLSYVGHLIGGPPGAIDAGSARSRPDRSNARSRSTR